MLYDCIRMYHVVVNVASFVSNYLNMGTLLSITFGYGFVCNFQLKWSGEFEDLCH